VFVLVRAAGDRVTDLDTARRIDAALGALHKLSVGAGESRMWANEAVLHRIYTEVDESFADVRENRDRLARRVAELEAVIEWVLQHGEQGKQSRRRLKGALAGDGGGA